MGKKREEFRRADSGNRSSFSSPALGTDGWMVISNPLVEGRHSKAEVHPTQPLKPLPLPNYSRIDRRDGTVCFEVRVEESMT